MGTWGGGNFESDTAADHLSEITGRLVDEIAEAMKDPAELEPDEYWGNAVPCNVELLSLIASKNWAGTTLPDPAIVEEWKQFIWTFGMSALMNLSPRLNSKKKGAHHS